MVVDMVDILLTAQMEDIFFKATSFVGEWDMVRISIARRQTQLQTSI